MTSSLALMHNMTDSRLITESVFIQCAAHNVLLTLLCRLFSIQVHFPFHASWLTYSTKLDVNSVNVTAMLNLLCATDWICSIHFNSISEGRKSLTICLQSIVVPELVPHSTQEASVESWGSCRSYVHGALCLPADVDLFNYQTAPGMLSPSSVFFVLLYFIILALRSKMVLRDMPDLNKSNEEDKRRATAVILRDPLLFTQAPPICN